MSPLTLVCTLTFLHYVGAQMRGPVLPLYAAEHGATATGVGVIVAAHMAVSAVGSVPLGRASDRWGRHRLLLLGMAISGVTSLLLPTATEGAVLAVIYGVAGLGVAAFTPSALSMVGDLASPGAAGRAYAWYATAHYGAIGIGAFFGGVVAQAMGYGAAFVVSAGIIAIALGLAVASGDRGRVKTTSGVRPMFAEIRGDRTVWAGWVLAAAGMVTQGVVFTFLPLMAHARGLSVGAIGVVFLTLGVANTGARIPAGWLLDRTEHASRYALGGVLVAALSTALLAAVAGPISLLAVAAVFGTASGIAGVAMGVALSQATEARVRGLVMGGYSTCLYLGLALGSFALGPIIARYGFVSGFAAAAAATVIGTLVAAGLWRSARPESKLRQGLSG